MTISKDLFKAILAMDVYNRGYNEGIIGLSDDIGTQIGSANITSRSDSDENSLERGASFYGLSFKITDGSDINGLLSGDTIVTYRGTDEKLFELLGV